MVTCQTIISVVSNPWFYAGTGLGILGLSAAYMYSSFTFLSQLSILARMSSPVNFILNIIKSVIRYNGFRYLAVYTTFQGTINAALQKKKLTEIINVLGQELWNKIVLSAKNIVDGFGLFVKWLGSASKACGYYNSSEILVSAIILVWTGVAAYIFVVWIWKLTWYDWRHREMEQQQWILLVLAITCLSLAAYGTGLVSEMLSNGQSLLNTTGELGAEVGRNGTINGTS